LALPPPRACLSSDLGSGSELRTITHYNCCSFGREWDVIVNCEYRHWPVNGDVSFVPWYALTKLLTWTKGKPPLQWMGPLNNPNRDLGCLPVEEAEAKYCPYEKVIYPVGIFSILLLNLH
jgi:hypothetical protein